MLFLDNHGKLYRIHERLLDAVENNAADEDHNQHEAQAVKQVTHIHSACPSGLGQGG